MSAHTLWESILPSACLWVCAILCASRMAGDLAREARWGMAPTGLCAAVLCIYPPNGVAFCIDRRGELCSPAGRRGRRPLRVCALPVVRRGLRTVEDARPYRFVRSQFVRFPAERCGYVGLPQGGEGGPRQRWMRMSAHTCRESTLPSAYLWVCIILDTSRMAGHLAREARWGMTPTGLCAAVLCIYPQNGAFFHHTVWRFANKKREACGLPLFVLCYSANTFTTRKLSKPNAYRYPSI